MKKPSTRTHWLSGIVFVLVNVCAPALPVRICSFPVVSSTTTAQDVLP